MSLELELKFLVGAADAPQVGKLLALYGQVTANPAQPLLNAYFDTPQQWFRRHDMGLRSRQKQGKFEQTIKLAGQQHGALQIRPEYNLPCAGVVPELAAFPSNIWPAQAEPAVLQQHLLELFRTDFIRQSWQLTSPQALIEIVYDQGEVRSGERRQLISELELELLDGDALALFDLAEFLLQALPLRAGWLSKAARGYQLYWQQSTPYPPAIPLSVLPAERLLRHLQRLQQLENCYSQQLNLALLQDVSAELQLLADILQDEGEQLLASQGRGLLRQLAEQQGLLFNQQGYQLWLLKLSRLLWQRQQSGC